MPRLRDHRSPRGGAHHALPRQRKPPKPEQGLAADPGSDPGDTNARPPRTTASEHTIVVVWPGKSRAKMSKTDKAIEAAIITLVADAPPLSEQTRARLAELFSVVHRARNR